MHKPDKIRAAVILIIYFSLILGFPHLSKSEDGYDKAVKLGIKLRAKPLLDFTVQRRIHVKNFGALPGDGQPDTQAIQAAIDAAAAGGEPAVIQFDEGIYRLNTGSRRTALMIEEAANLILDGRGCEFLILEPDKQFLGIRNSRRIIVKNMSVDFEIFPHTQGWVTAVNQDAGTFDIKLDPDYPDLDHPHFHNADYKWGFIKDKDNPVAFKEGTEFRLYLTDWSRTGENRYHLKVQHKIKLKDVAVGDPYVQISRIDGALLHATRSEDVTFMDLRIYASFNAVFATGYCTRPNFIRIKAAPREGRWLTSGADGCFNFGGREGPWVEDCYFEALGDDNLIIKGHRAYCVNIVDPYTFDLVHAALRFVRPQPAFEDYLSRDRNNPWMARPGDTLIVMDPVERAVVSQPVVLETMDIPAGIRVRVDRKIPGLRTGTDYEKALSFHNDDAGLPGFVVKNNEFKSAVRFGFLLKSRDGLVDGNLFERHSDQSICILNTYQEYNGGIPSNLLIQNNTFRLTSGWPVKTAQTAQHLLNPNRNIFGIVQASFNWPVSQWDIEESRLRVIRNLYIENNRFINWWQNPGIALNNGLHVLIKGNSFELDEAFAATALTGTPIAVKVVNSTDVRIEDNILSGPGLNPKDGIRLIESGRIVLKNNQKK